MAFDVVTAKQGKPHVTADQQALMQAGMLGKGRYALDALNNLACTMTDSNMLTVDTGGLMVDGRWVVNEAQTSFAIANGSQAQFRKDLAVLEITVDPSTGVTSLEEKVLQGATAATEAAAADPPYEAGDLYTGLTATVPIARITLNGLTPTCTALLPSVASLKSLGDSVSRVQQRIFTGTKVVNFGNTGETGTELFSVTEQRSLFGRVLTNNDFVGVMNGDAETDGSHIDCASRFLSDSTIYVAIGAKTTGRVRINYLVVLGE